MHSSVLHPFFLSLFVAKMRRLESPIIRPYCVSIGVKQKKEKSVGTHAELGGWANKCWVVSGSRYLLNVFCGIFFCLFVKCVHKYEDECVKNEI